MVNIISKFSNPIPYFKDLRSLTGSITSTILMQQLEYWFDKYPDGFYKFLSPSPNNNAYKEGDSWVEETGFSEDEFRTAFDKIGTRYKSKKEYNQENDAFKGKFYCSYHDKIKGLTYYFRDHGFLDNTLIDFFDLRKQGIPIYVNGVNQVTDIGKTDIRKQDKSSNVSKESKVTEIGNSNPDYNTEITTETTTEITTNKQNHINDFDKKENRLFDIIEFSENKSESLTKKQKDKIIKHHGNMIEEFILANSKVDIKFSPKTMGYIYGNLQREGIDKYMAAIKAYLSDPYKISRNYYDLEKLLTDEFMISQFAGKNYDSKTIENASKLIMSYNTVTGANHDIESKLLIEAIVNMSKALTFEVVWKGVIGSAFDNKGVSITDTLRRENDIIKYSGKYDSDGLSQKLKQKIKEKSIPDYRRMDIEQIKSYNWENFSNEKLINILPDKYKTEWINSGYDMIFFKKLIINIKSGVV